MSVLRKLLSWIGLRPISAPRKYEVSESMQVTLTTLAQHEGRPEDELIQNLLAAGLTHYYETEELWKQWETLSPREKEVTGVRPPDAVFARAAVFRYRALVSVWLPLP